MHQKLHNEISLFLALPLPLPVHTPGNLSFSSVSRDILYMYKKTWKYIKFLSLFTRKDSRTYRMHCSSHALSPRVGLGGKSSLCCSMESSFILLMATRLQRSLTCTSAWASWWLVHRWTLNSQSLRRHLISGSGGLSQSPPTSKIYKGFFLHIPTASIGLEFCPCGWYASTYL